MTASPVRLQDDLKPRAVSFAGGNVVGASTHSPARAWNEDAGAVIPLGPREGVLAVADGAGGHAGSEAVAAAALDAFERSLRQEGSGSLFERVCTAVEAAHRAASRSDPDAGTTLVCAVIEGDRFRTVHAGDSGVLLFGQRGKRKFETVAHSPVGYAQEAGVLSEQEALHHEDRHLVSSLLGFEDHHIEMSRVHEIAVRDTLLLASDGLLDNLSVEEIVEIARQGSLLNAVQNLVACAQMRMVTPEAGQPSKPDDLTVLAYRRA